MDLINWIPSITTTSLLALALWLGRNLLITRLKKSVEHEYNIKLETVRAEFREKDEKVKANLRFNEAEIAVLRGEIITAMASRQMALDKRRLEAVEQLWSAVTTLGPAKAVSSLMSNIKFDVFAEGAASDPKFVRFFEQISTIFDQNKIDLAKMPLNDFAKFRPFVSPMAWALFSAYYAIVTEAVIKLHIIKSGMGAKDYFDKDAVPRLVKAVLPHQAEYIEKFGETGYSVSWGSLRSDSSMKYKVCLKVWRLIRLA